MKYARILNPKWHHVTKISVFVPTIMLLFMASCVNQTSDSTMYQKGSGSISRADEDNRAIETIYQNWYTAWETKDYKLASQDYSDDAIWVNAFGMRRVGREEIEETLKFVFAMDSVMAGKSQTVQKTIRFIEPDVALVTSRVERVGQQTQAGETLATRKTSHLRVFVKSGGRWQIVSHLMSDARSKESSDH